MMNIIILILIISANCVKMNCDEDASTTENVNGVSEKTELNSADRETLKNETENKENENDTSKTSGNGEEIRVSRSSSDHSTENEMQSENSSKLLSTEASLTEKSTSDEIVSETQDKKTNNTEDKQPTRRANSASATEEDKNSSEKVEKQLEELTKTSAPDTEERKPKDLMEASAESKLSDNEKASSSIDDTDRTFKTDEVKEKSDDSLFNEIRATRRMFSAPDNIVVDTKMRADTISTTVEPEVRTALNQNLKTYNNYKEFGTDSHTKLSDSSIAELSPRNAKTNMPIIKQLAPEETLNQRYLPKFYPQPELGIVFPNVNSDFHGPRDLPIYLEVKQGEIQSQNQFMGPQMSQFESTEENMYFNPNNQQQYHQPQRNLPAQGSFTNKQFVNVQIESRNQVPRIYQNQVPTHLKNNIENKQFANLNQGSRNQIQQFHQNQEKINPNYKNVRDLNLEGRNTEIEENLEMSLRDDDLGNQYPLFRQPQGKMDTKINVEQKQFRTEHLENPYPYFHHPSSPQINVALIPPHIKVLFQKLASASLFPKNLQTNLKNNNNIQKYPYIAIPG